MKKIVLSLFVLVVASGGVLIFRHLHTSVAIEPVPVERKAYVPLQQPVATVIPISPSGHRYDLSMGLKAIVEGKAVTLYDTNGKKLATNGILARLQDENGSCPSDGFLDIVSKGNYFTIEQQNCSGSNFINEYITFVYSSSDATVRLSTFGLQYIDRTAPDKEIPEKTYTEKDFGSISFEQTDVDALYRYAR